MREKPFFPATLGGLFGLVAVMEGSVVSAEQKEIVSQEERRAFCGWPLKEREQALTERVRAQQLFRAGFQQFCEKTC
jgi:hypothetical protein